MLKQDKRFYRLIQTTTFLNSSQNERVILSEILKAIRYVMNTSASSVLLLDKALDELYFYETSGGSAQIREIRLKVGEGIAGWVAKHKKPLIVHDVNRDKRFAKRVDKKTGLKTQSIICVPLIANNELLGVLEAMNKKKGKFNSPDLQLFMAFAAQAATALHSAQLYSMAHTDSLTGAYGRRYFQTWLEQDFERAKRYNMDFSLVLLDIDNFKQINDKYGHQAGDYVLLETVMAIKENLRKTDMVARYGGEEFAVIMPHTRIKVTKEISVRLRKIIDHNHYAWKGQTIPVTVSMGISSFNKNHPRSSDDMIASADKALYEAKKTGRNKVCVAK
ncbi:diguanylate cyclase [Elusimicrobiota bacterium]